MLQKNFFQCLSRMGKRGLWAKTAAVVAGALLSAAAGSNAWAANDKRWDIDANGNEDFVFQIVNGGRVRLVRMNDTGGTARSSEELGGLPNRYRIVMGAGDFNNNGNKELLVYDLENNKLAIWPISATGMQSESSYYTSSTAYADLGISGLRTPTLRTPVVYGQTPQGTADDMDSLIVRPYDVMVVADLNGDGSDDFVLRDRSTLNMSYHLIKGVAGTDKGFTQHATGTLSVGCSSCELVGAGNLDNNGSDDLIFHNTSAGTVFYVLTQPSTSSVSITKQGTLGGVSMPHPSHKIVGMRDINGDGIADLVAHVDDPSLSKQVKFWEFGPPPSQGSGPVVDIQGVWDYNLPVDTWRILGVRDVNGDSRADLLVHHRQTEIVSSLNTGVINTNTQEVPVQSNSRILAVSKASRFVGSPSYGPAYSSPVEETITPNPFPTAALTSTYGGGDHSANLAGTSVYYSNGQTKRTFYVYPECDGKTGSGDSCSGNPAIMSFDHVTGQWSAPHRIALQPFNGLHDAHAYPQLLIDSTGYLHVFYSGHVHPLKHYKSPAAANATWNQLTQPWTDAGLKLTGGQEISYADKATYIMPAKTNAGILYLFWRQSYIYEIPGTTTPNRYDHDPCQLHAYDIYEPWYYSFSIDNGATWSASTMILNPLKKAPPANPYTDSAGGHDADEAGWDSYYASFRYVPENDEFHVSFSLSQYHNCAHRQTSFAKLSPDPYTHFLEAYSMSGVQMSGRIDQNEDTIANDTIFHLYGGTLGTHSFFGQTIQWQKPGAGAGIGVITGRDKSGGTHIFYHDYDHFGMPSVFHSSWVSATSSWSAPTRLYNSQGGYKDHRIFAVKFDPNTTSNYSLYLAVNTLSALDSNLHAIERWDFNSLSSPNPGMVIKLMEVKNSGKRFYDLSQVTGVDMSLSNRHEFSFWQGTYKPMASVGSDGRAFGWGANQFW